MKVRAATRSPSSLKQCILVSTMLDADTFVWPVLGIERYQTLTIPESVRKIIIYSQHGREAVTAIERARPHLTAHDRELFVKLPSHRGDWNDLLREIRAA